MTAIEHYCEAEKLLEELASSTSGKAFPRPDGQSNELLATRALAHATLAQAAIAALAASGVKDVDGLMRHEDRKRWREIAGESE